VEYDAIQTSRCLNYSVMGQLRTATDPWILQLKLELQLVGNRIIGIRIYRTQIPAFVGMQLKQFNLFYAAHISLPYL
jgi:hypothetical protein